MATAKHVFMVHKHQATHVHYDLRLEIEGTLKSWALRELPLKPSDPILAIQVADHPYWYRHFEGVIPEGHYGAGPVMVWDKGVYTSFMRDRANKRVPLEESLQQGFLMIWLEGHKLQGGYLLIRVSKKQRWLMIKLEDEFVRQGRMPSGWNRSIKSGKTLQEIASSARK